MFCLTVAGEPTRLTATVSQANMTHVNITVSWEAKRGNATGYVIYYSRNGENSSEMVSGGEKREHSLIGLQRGVTYSISMLALSSHLPSLLVGPVTVVLCESTSHSINHTIMHSIALSIRSTSSRDLK